MFATIITKDNFRDEVILSDIPVMIDFWAPWCGPCRMLTPIVEHIARDYAGDLKVGKVNVEIEGDLADEFGITSIPTIIFFKNRLPVETNVGFRTKEQLEDSICQLMENCSSASA